MSRLYEPAEFILTFLKDRLTFHPTHRAVAIHLTCSTREMGLSDTMLEVARMCTDNVFVPEGIGCCGFAGDRGFSRPELNDWALRSLHGQIAEHHIERGYSNSRTCEIGLERPCRHPLHEHCVSRQRVHGAKKLKDKWIQHNKSGCCLLAAPRFVISSIQYQRKNKPFYS